MKKKLIIITILSALLLLFTGCKSEPEPLRICMDLDYVNHLDQPNVMTLEFLNTLEQSGGLSDVEIEYIPAEGGERESALDRIRAEMMAGEGPDVFIVNCVGSVVYGMGDALFSIPEKAMENGLFLPLDEYMENNTRFTEWDKQTQSVLEAGRNEEGQQIIPLTYTLPVLCYQKADVSYTPEGVMTWEEMLADEELADAAGILSDCCFYMPELNEYFQDNNFEFLFGKLADYKEEELSFTEEELLQRVKDVFALREKTKSGAYADQPVYDESNFGVNTIASTDGVNANEPMTMIPLYSDDGGCTATILSFAAVNRNTKRPEDAFTVIDLLLRDHVQQNYIIYKQSLLTGIGVPMHEELMRADTPVGQLQRGMTEENFAEFCEVRSQISTATFQNTLSSTLQYMLLDCETALQNGESIEGIVHDSYEKMELLLAE